MSEEESIIASFIEAIEGTKSTAEFTFENLTIKLPGMNASIVINGKVSVMALPLHGKTA
jgi:hypothetical protein